ncbi:HAD family hydrolase [Alloscardovia macacae]|uniref:Haloacid dehalogenase n=1 Tax=Alloscardovia macacae TaxID=1160091 RepID=A0A261F5J7_9BIFI|nr:HAD family phosphatase [Alloscardovia macacae]OZG54391.1 haloacid dehalogenase [Alloscardovia macacae]
MTIRAAIFDFDGTLFDSMPIWENLSSSYLLSLGITPHADLEDAVVTMSLEDAARYFRSEYGVTKSVDEILADIHERIDHAYRCEVLPKPGIPEFLESLALQGVRMGIATATDRKFIELALERCGLAHYFATIVTSADVGTNKREPDIYREALRRLNAKRNETLVFEDALHAAQTATRDGFTVVGVPDTSEPNQAALKDISTYYVEENRYEDCINHSG